MNKGKWSKKNLRRIARFLATLEGHMSVHRTRGKLLERKIIMLMVGGRKRNKGNNTDIFDLHFT